MKKLLILTAITLLFAGCHKDDILLPEVSVSPDLKIANSAGIKLESSFVTSEVAMNVKTEYSGSVTIKILDIGNKVVQKRLPPLRLVTIF